MSHARPGEGRSSATIDGDTKNEVIQPGGFAGHQVPRRRCWFARSLAAATGVLLLGAWLSSGTMAPYAATLDPKIVRIQQPCEYLTNIDHLQFEATFWMLQGQPRNWWEGSVVLRRLLYPILAFPLMSALGFENGGFATNLIITVLAFVAFVFFVRRTIGERAAIATSSLLATYPGIAYWVGLPYSYVWIVPGSLLLTILLWRLSATVENLTTFVISLAMGFVFWGYDLFPFFGSAALLILARQRRFRQLPVALLGMVAALAALFVCLHVIFRVPLRNSNTESYWNVIRSFASQIDYAGWSRLIWQVPSIFFHNFFDSNFLFLPLLFLILALLRSVRDRSVSIQTPELEILSATLLVFLFNNLAPPYSGWQLRGEWIARLYQPVFVAFILYAGRVIQDSSKALGDGGAWLGRISPVLTALAVVANGFVVFGPFLQLPIASKIYQRFYRHSPSPDSLQLNVLFHGRRPLGICKRSPSSE